MAEKPAEKGTKKKSSSAPLNSEQMHPEGVEQFVAQLSDEQRMLILLKNELYESSWEAMREDLSNRLDGKPYIFKLANRIKEDMDRIQQLQNYEDEHHVNLADYLKPLSE